IHSQLNGYEKRLSQDDMIGFIKTEFGRVGANQNLTPREIIRDFVELLNILYQNPDKTVGDLMSEKEFPSEVSDPQGGEGVSEDYAEFTL
ncbi:MAG: BREX system ATP-binding domain-containing protein, partial [Clostridia bacterium]